MLFQFCFLFACIAFCVECHLRIAYRKTTSRYHYFMAEYVSTFNELAGKAGMFLDRTPLIKEIVNCPAQVLLITYPVGWGKSVNIDMIRRFVEIETPIKNISINRRLFYHQEVYYYVNKTPVIEHLRNPLEITRDKDFMEKHFGKYPTIFVNFTNLLPKFHDDWYPKIVKRVKSEITRAYRAHPKVERYLRVTYRTTNDTALRKKLEPQYEAFLKFYHREKADLTSILTSLRMLTRILSDYYHKKVYVLIDEWDHPIVTMYQKRQRLNMREASDIVDFFGALYHQTFNQNNRIKKAVISGLFRMLKWNLNDQALSYIEFNLFRGRLASYYAVARPDVERLFKKRNFHIYVHEKGLSYYGGYTIPPNKNMTFYDLSCIADYSNSEVPGTKAVIPDHLEFISEMVDHKFVQMTLIRLLNDEAVCMCKKWTFFTAENFSSLHDLAYCINLTEPLYSVEVLLGYLFVNGITSIRQSITPVLTLEPLVQVRFANPFLKALYSTYMLRHLTHIIKVYSPFECLKRDLIVTMNTKTKTQWQGEMEFSLSKLVRDFRHHSKYGGSQDRFDRFVEYWHQVMVIWCIDTQLWSYFHLEAYPYKRLDAEFVMYDRGKSHALIVDVTFDENNAVKALHQAKRCTYKLDTIAELGRPILSVKYIGINVIFKGHHVQMASEWMDFLPNSYSLIPEDKLYIRGVGGSFLANFTGWESKYMNNSTFDFNAIDDIDDKFDNEFGIPQENIDDEIMSDQDSYKYNDNVSY